MIHDTMVPCPWECCKVESSLKIGLRPVIHISDVDTIYEIPEEKKKEDGEVVKEKEQVSNASVVEVAVGQVEVVRSAMDHEQDKK